MKQFSILLESLLLTPARNQKIAQMVRYFRAAPDPDRGYALAVLTGGMSLRQVKSALLKDVVLAKVDPQLFAMSYDYVGDLAETIALIWPDKADAPLPTLSGLVEELETLPPAKLPGVIAGHLSSALPTERWAIIKLATGNLRVGVSARLAKTALAEFGGKSLEEIERVWHGLEAPYLDLFTWLEDRGPVPEIHHHKVFHPMMLSTPIDEAKDFAALDPADYQAEWKWDGIRVQLVLSAEEKRMYSRTGDDISHTFPDVTAALGGTGVLDGELLVGKDFDVQSFNDLQQRLNRKTVNKKMLEDFPAFVRVYDILFDGDEDVRGLPLVERRERLERWAASLSPPLRGEGLGWVVRTVPDERERNTLPNPSLLGRGFEEGRRLDVSPILPFSTWEELAELRLAGAEQHGHEGIMLKRKDSVYVAGRPRGPWFKWKRDPRLIDAVLMYAQRGHGKRSSFYSDYTFGVWQGKEIVPVGKAYFGFTDEELAQLDKWIRNNTIERYGPVRQVKMELVFEVAFDAAQLSARHKSGVALRFPRINRIRWDKPAQEADTIDNVRALIGV